jgi:hypothetical protein
LPTSVARGSLPDEIPLGPLLFNDAAHQGGGTSQLLGQLRLVRLDPGRRQGPQQAKFSLFQSKPLDQFRQSSRGDPTGGNAQAGVVEQLDCGVTRHAAPD